MSGPRKALAPGNPVYGRYVPPGGCGAVRVVVMGRGEKRWRICAIELTRLGRGRWLEPGGVATVKAGMVVVEDGA